MSESSGPGTFESRLRLDGQVAVITGKGGGIGRGIALALARRREKGVVG
jgi:NAD(P)-dependent dehydrogenase (short-subunit alcohol dehydrogenase family)